MIYTVTIRILIAFLFFPASFLFSQNMAINLDGALPDSNAIVDISSTTSGLLIPRMTMTQRDAIVTPPIGLQVFNLTTNTLDIYKSTGWASMEFIPSSTNVIHVSELSELPAPVGSEILLDGTKIYHFLGIVNISPYYLNLNGAGLAGTDPSKDGIMSTVSGAILRSTDLSVFIQKLTVLPASASTKAYDFSDATGTRFCTLFSGCAVGEVGVPSLGVGQVSGFKGITVVNNFWECKDGIKVTGNVGSFAIWLSYLSGITAGSAIEFLSGATINDVDLSNNYFFYAGQTGVKLNVGANISNGRMTTNMFRGVDTPLSGFDSYSFGWKMEQNTEIPNTRSYGYAYMDGNTTSTTFSSVGVFRKILGTTILVNQSKFTDSNNRFTYTGKSTVDTEVFAVVGARAPFSGADYTIVVAKNGVVIPAPTSSLGPMGPNQGFQIVLQTEVSLSTNDYIEIFIRNNINTNSLVVSDLQFRVAADD